MKRFSDLWGQLLDMFPFWHVIATAAVFVALSGCGSIEPIEPQPDDPIIEPGPEDPGPFEPQPDQPQPSPRPQPPNPFDDDGQPAGQARPPVPLPPDPTAAIAKQTSALMAQNELMVKRLAETEAKLAAASKRADAARWSGCEIHVREDETCEHCRDLVRDLTKEAKRRGWTVGRERAPGVHFVIVDVGEHEDVPQAFYFVKGQKRPELEIDGYSALPGEINKYFENHPLAQRPKATQRLMHERIGEDLFGPETIIGQAERRGFPEVFVAADGFTYRKRSDGYLGYRAESADDYSNVRWERYVAYPVESVTTYVAPQQHVYYPYAYSYGGCVGGVCYGGGCPGGIWPGR